MYRINEDGEFFQDNVKGVQENYVQIGYAHQAMYYSPVQNIEVSHIGVIFMHCDQNYMGLHMGPQLAAFGYQVLACDSEFGEIENKFNVLNEALKFLRKTVGVDKVILMGHSGGATLMTAYQSIAENGTHIYQTPEKLYKTTFDKELIPADGIMLIDANYGNGPMTLLSLDPAVVEEGNGMKLDPELDIFNPLNGYDPQGAHYSEAFLKKYFKAQAARNKRLINKALDRLTIIRAGKGHYADDEPFVITAGNQPKPNNRLIPHLSFRKM